VSNADYCDLLLIALDRKNLICKCDDKSGCQLSCSST